jgi:adenylyltransferase/sulfurtransferase
VLTGKPNVYGSIFRSKGKRASSGPNEGRAIAAYILNRRHQGWYRRAPKAACSVCFRNRRHDPGERSDQGHSCAEGILLNRLLLFDAWKMTFRQLKLRKDPSCPLCGDNPTIHGLIDYEDFAV